MVFNYASMIVIANSALSPAEMPNNINRIAVNRSKPVNSILSSVTAFAPSAIENTEAAAENKTKVSASIDILSLSFQGRHYAGYDCHLEVKF